MDCYMSKKLAQVIDTINPATGRTSVWQRTEAEILNQFPDAERVTVSEFMAWKTADQARPVKWRPTSSESYYDMLSHLEPAAMHKPTCSFLLGDPSDTDAATGQPRYIAFRELQNGDCFVSNRPMTVDEFFRLMSEITTQ